VFSGAKPVAHAAYERAFDALSHALFDASEAEGDKAGSQIALPLLDHDAKAWFNTAAAAIGPLDMGVDLEAMSVKDWSLLDETEPNRLVRQGVGTLIGRMAFGLPIAVNAPVRAIASQGAGVAVTTDRGTVRARAAIVTVSVGVLSAGAIRIEPSLATAMDNALGGLQMGLLSKVALAYAPSSPLMRFSDGSVLLPQAADQRGHSFLVRPFGAPLVVCFVGGSLAWDLSTRGEAEAVAFARDGLRALFGNEADRGFRKGTATGWGGNPLTRGAYSAARPGRWQARHALGTPMNDRVFLAGEALAGRGAQTAHGAYQNGQAVARRVLQLLKR
jgi:monoamine oxidase